MVDLVERSRGVREFDHFVRGAGVRGKEKERIGRGVVRKSGLRVQQ